MNLVAPTRTFRPRHDLIFRPIRREDVGAISTLYRRCFGIDPSQAYIRWRYLDTPLGVTPTMLAFDRDDCIGSYGVWPTKLLLSGTRVAGGQAIDSMTHPDYRGRGLFVELGEHCYEVLQQLGIRVLYGFPNESAYPGRIRRLNWDHVDDIHHWVRPLWVAGASPFGRLVAAGSLLWRPTSVAGDLRIETAAAPEAEGVAALLRACEETHDLCRVERSPEWLAWRYHPASGRDYRWIACYAERELAGFCVWRFDATTRRASIAELAGHPQALATLLSAVLTMAYRLQVRIIDIFTNDPKMLRLMRSAGFVRRSSERFMVRSLTGMTLPANVHWRAAWRIFGGDFDAF